MSRPAEHQPHIALAGNPNVGKSTIFNALTHGRQHTGNWPGKTVEVAQGCYTYKARTYRLTDLPGAYSLQGSSQEEQLAAEFLREGEADCVIAVCDATCLERSLRLALELLERTDRLLLCVNLLDEAESHHISIDLRELERVLGIPVVGVSAGRREGLDRLQERVRNLTDGFERTHPHRLGRAGERLPPNRFIRRAEALAAQVTEGTSSRNVRQRRLDRFLTGRFTGAATLLVLLFLLFWLTIQGANYPSQLLERAFSALIRSCWRLSEAIHAPNWLASPLIDGVLATTGQVIAVMLPPLVIFFPLFTILEEAGYLPRLAFLLDTGFSRCGTCGKQALTTCMAFGCNAAGVTGARIIDSPRERLLAILTNSFIPCNGRFPALIALSTLLCGSAGSLSVALLLTGWVLLGVSMSLAVSALLSKTLLQGMPSAFALELPPYRRPNLSCTLLRSVLDRTLRILARAVAVAAPAGLVLWCFSHIYVGDASILTHAARLLNPLGRWMGLSGAILLAFVLAFPANELVLPVALLASSGAGLLAGAGMPIAQALSSSGWTGRTALCAAVFFLFHWPCSTTLLTIKKETGSWKWTLLAVALPTTVGMLLCGLLNWLLP